MTGQNRYSIALLFVLVLCSCGQPHTPDTSRPDSISAADWAELLRIDRANPLSDLQAAIQTNDFRFLGIYGVGFSAPGIKSRPLLANIKPIKGTSDAFVSEEHLRLILEATKYAEVYNRTLDSYLKTNRFKSEY
jgi:hypothetical protein